MLSHKELIYLEDFLLMQELSVKTINELSGLVEDDALRQFLLILAKKNEDSFATMGAYINSGQKLHMKGI